MTPLQIELRNFFCFEEVTYRFAKSGVILVEGRNQDSEFASSNGSGKSALLVEGIMWALFGKTARGLSGDAVIRQGSEGGCSVVLRFKTQAREYTVTRYQGNPTLKNLLQLQREGPTVGGSIDRTTTDKNRTQQEIERALGFGFTVARHILFVGQKSLSFIGATDATKKQILREVLGLERFESAQKEASRQARNLLGNRHNLEVRIEGCQVRVTEAKESRKEFKQRHQDALSRNAETHAKVQERQAQLDNHLSLLQQGLADWGAVQEQLAALAEQEQAAAKYSATLQEVGKQLGHIQNAKDMAQGICDRIRDELAATSQKVMRCPQCGQVLPAAKLAEFRTRQQDKRQKIAKYETEIRDYDKQIALIQFRQMVLQVAMQDHRQVQLQSQEINQRRIQLEKMQLELIEVKRESQELQKQLRKLDDEGSSFLDLLLDASFRLYVSLRALKGLQEKHLAICQECDILEYWRTGFGPRGLQSYLLEQVLEMLNHRTRYYGEILFGAEIAVDFSTTDTLADGSPVDRLQVRCANVKGASEYSAHSAGEQSKLDLAVTLALQDLVAAQLGIPLKYTVLDECVPFADAQSISHVAELLQALERDRGAIFFVSHHPEFREHFEDRLLISKKDGAAVIEDQEMP